MKKLLLLLPALIVLPAAEKDFSASGFDHFYNLEYDAAIADFEQAARAAPDDPAPHNHIAQAVLYREMFRNGALESELVTGHNSILRRERLNAPPETQKRFDAEIRRASELAQARLDHNPNDTSALYQLGVSNGLHANYDFLVRKAWRDALSETTAARKLHNRVTELDPSNYDARLVQGIHDYIVGSLNWYYRSLGFLIGFRGDRQQGIRTLEEVAQKGNVNRDDAQVALCALYRRERQPAKALPLLADLNRRYPRNYLFRMETARMYSDAGDKDRALATIDEVANLKQKGAPGYANVRWETIYYEMGNVQFWYNDLEPALENLKKVTASTQDMDLTKGVLAFMRQGQIYDMTNRRELAVEQYRKAIAVAPQSEAAKESRRYIGSPYKRN